MGQDGVDFLRGKIGDTDVKDMQNAVHEILKTFSFLDKNNIFLYGKSFGGFLVGQLSGQHPVMRINIFYYFSFKFLISINDH